MIELINNEHLVLESRQSRAHEFVITMGTDKHVFDITCTIVSNGKKIPMPSSI